LFNVGFLGCCLPFVKKIHLKRCPKMYQHKRWWGLPRRGKTVSRTLKCTYCCGVPFEFLLSFSTKEFLALGQNLKIHVLRGHKKPSEAELENSCFTGRGVGSHGVGWQRSGRVHDARQRQNGEEGGRGGRETL
jgi:hypothetical protein